MGAGIHFRMVMYALMCAMLLKLLGRVIGEDSHRETQRRHTTATRGKQHINNRE